MNFMQPPSSNCKRSTKDTPLPLIKPFRTLLRPGLFLAALLLAASACAEMPLTERYQRLKSGAETMLPGTSINLVSTEQDGMLGAEVTSLLPYPFATAAPALASVENWCHFMPLHFNIKACTFEMQSGSEQLTLYSGRKSYQSPEESHALVYRVAKKAQSDGVLLLLLRADRGPANTRDYRIEVNAMRVAEGTLLHIRSSYRPSMTSSLLTRTYLSTLGRDKVGFTHIEQDGVMRPVQGVRGVIERNVMRYQLAIDAFLGTHQLPDIARREAALTRWFTQNDNYPRQLHEMPREEYLAIKHREWENQQRLQQALNEQQRLVALR